MFLPYRKADSTPFGDIDIIKGLGYEQSSFGPNLLRFMHDETGQFKLETIGESDYYKMWVFLRRLKIKPYELDKISVEDQNVLWKMLQYEDEQTKHDSFMANSRNADKKK